MRYQPLFVCSIAYLSAVSGSIYDEVRDNAMPMLDGLQESLLPFPPEVMTLVKTALTQLVLPLNSSNQLCRDHSRFLQQSFFNRDLWALRLMDASSKLPSGVLDGNFFEMGSYDQCLEVEAPGGMFKGQYCTVRIQSAAISEMLKRTGKMFGLLAALCIPSSCSFKDIQDHLNSILRSVKLSVALDEAFCDTADDKPWDWVDWAGCLFFLFLFVLVIASTAYDCRAAGGGKKSILSVFSLRANVPHMVSTARTPEAVGCLDGLRVFAICWVMAGHQGLRLVFAPSLHTKFIIDNVDMFTLAPFKNGTLSVEIFFVLTGTLVVYSYLRYRHKGINFNIFYFYLHRYFRLAPALAAVVLLDAGIVQHMNDGPFWKGMRKAYHNCRREWLPTILFVNNHIKTDGKITCLSQSWYLAVDFQLYLLSPLVLIPLYRKPRVGLLLAGVFYLASTVLSLWNIASKELQVGLPFQTGVLRKELTNEEYITSYYRAHTFLIGMVLGYVIYNIKQGHLIIKMSKTALWTGWVLSVSLMIADIYLINWFPIENYKYNPWLDTPYIVFSRQVFALSIAWVILACTLGYGGWVDHFLSWRGWMPLSRITYSAFLLHLVVQDVLGFEIRKPITFFWRDFWYSSLGYILFSYLAAAVLYLTVEAPCCNIVDWVLIGNKKEELANRGLPKESVATEPVADPQLPHTANSPFGKKFF